MRDRHLDKLPVGEIAAIFGTRYPLANYPERFKIAPTDPAPGASIPTSSGARSTRCAGVAGRSVSEPF
jgi:hypothetical protein